MPVLVCSAYAAAYAQAILRINIKLDLLATRAMPTEIQHRCSVINQKWQLSWQWKWQWQWQWQWRRLDLKILKQRVLDLNLFGVVLYL